MGCIYTDIKWSSGFLYKMSPRKNNFKNEVTSDIEKQLIFFFSYEIELFETSDTTVSTLLSFNGIFCCTQRITHGCDVKRDDVNVLKNRAIRHFPPDKKRQQTCCWSTPQSHNAPSDRPPIPRNRHEMNACQGTSGQWRHRRPWPTDLRTDNHITRNEQESGKQDATVCITPHLTVTQPAQTLHPADMG